MYNETIKIVSEGEHFADLVKSKGWGLVKDQVITPFLMDMQSVRNIKRSSVTDMAREVYARQIAVDYVLDMVKQIEGRAEQHAQNLALTQDPIQIM